MLLETKVKLISLMERRRSISPDMISREVRDILGGQKIGWEYGSDPENPELDLLSFSILHRLNQPDVAISEKDLPISGQGWRVQAGIPPRGWEKYFEYTDFSGNIYSIEGCLWKWAAIKLGSAWSLMLSSDIDLGASAKEIAEILLVGEIGEENFRKFIKEVTFVEMKKSDLKSMRVFRRCFLKEFSDCYYAKFLREN